MPCIIKPYLILLASASLRLIRKASKGATAIWVLSIIIMAGRPTRGRSLLAAMSRSRLLEREHLTGFGSQGPAEWTGKLHGGGTTTPGSGNILMGDGSGQQTTDSSLVTTWIKNEQDGGNFLSSATPAGGTLGFYPVIGRTFWSLNKASARMPFCLPRQSTQPGWWGLLPILSWRGGALFGGLVERLPSLVKRQLRMQRGGSRRIGRRADRAQGAVGCLNRFGEIAIFRVSCRQGAQNDGILVSGKLGCARGQLHCFGAVSQSGVGIGGQNPSQIVASLRVGRLNPERLHDSAMRPVLACLEQGVAQLIMKRRLAGLKRDGLAKTDKGLGNEPVG